MKNNSWINATNPLDNQVTNYSLSKVLRTIIDEKHSQKL